MDRRHIPFVWEDCAAKFLLQRSPVPLTPGPHGVQNGLQALSQVRQGVFHPWRDLGIDLSVDQTVSNPIFEVFYLDNPHGVIADFSGNPPYEF